MKKLLLLLGGLAGVLGVVILGFQRKPKPLPKYDGVSPTFETIPLPTDLPESVYRFYETITGEHVPIICSSVLTARTVIRLGRMPLHGRVRFTHRAGYDYRHYMELNWFDMTCLKVDEHYLDGKFTMALSLGTMDVDDNMISSANQAVWGEALFFPTVFVTDGRVTWEDIDDHTARLIVPFEHEPENPTQEFTVYFDPKTNLIKRMETTRYRDAESGMVGWILEASDWKLWQGMMIPSVGKVTWADQNEPWLEMVLDDVAFNVDVSEYIQKTGL